MKAFKFRMDRILDFRERMEDLLKMDLSIILAQLRKEEERMESFISQYKDGVEAMLDVGELTAAEVEAHRAFLLRIKDDLQQAKDTVEIFKKMSSEKKKEFLSARRDRKVLDAIKEKDHREHAKMMIKEEEGFMDEYNAHKFIKDKFC